MSQNIKINENEVAEIPVPEPIKIVVILDASSSMDTMGSEPVDSINNFFEEQKKNGDFNGTLVIFNEKVNILYQNVKSCDIKPLTKEEYNPKGMTALRDAIGKTIVIQKEKKTKKGICLIITDGLENASVEFDDESIKKLIKEMETDYNWNFNYIGANQNSFKVGRSIGIKSSADYQYTPSGFKKMIREVSCSVSKCVSGEVPIDNFELKVDQTFKNKKRKFGCINYTLNSILHEDSNNNI